MSTVHLQKIYTHRHTSSSLHPLIVHDVCCSYFQFPSGSCGLRVGSILELKRGEMFCLYMHECASICMYCMLACVSVVQRTHNTEKYM